MSRPGAYRATVSASETLRRSQVQPTWLEPSSALSGALRVSSSVLDVVEKPGTPVAVIGEDGIPERPMVIGAITGDDFQPGDRTVWLRAHLDAPATEGHFEIGATQGLRLKVGDNTGAVAPEVNTFIIDAGALTQLRLRTSGKLAVSNATGELIASAIDALTAAKQAIDGLALVSAALATANLTPATPVTNGTLFTLFAGVGAATIPPAATQIAAALVTLATFKE